MDGTDGLTAVNSPSIVTGVEETELLATSFDGVMDYINATTDVALTAIGTGAFSFGCFLKTSDVGVMDVFSKGNSEDQTGFVMTINGSERGTFRLNQFSFITPGTINNGVFRHLFFTSSGTGGTGRLYLDGTQVATGACPSYNFDSSGNMVMAVYSNLFTPNFNGSIDGVRFYDYEVSAGIVSDLSNYQTPE